MKVPIDKVIKDQEKFLTMSTIPPEKKDMIRKSIALLKTAKKNGCKYVEVR